jgi:alanyl-tRNA synthetase
MTLRLDLHDSSLLVFDAEVVDVRRLGDRAAVVLDRTAFYPEGGGQPADRGRLSGVAVVDVQEVDGEVLHAVEGEPPAGPGGKVRGEVDPRRRRDHLQQHHGQHLLSAAFEKVAGAATVSFHLGEATCTVDLDRPLGEVAAALRAAEAYANDLVFRDLPVTARDFTAEELARLPLRKEPARGARVVVVAGAPLGEGSFDTAGIEDASPCGGTHPRRTGEVGAVAVLRAQKWGAGARVEFLCGGRVVRALAEASHCLQEAAQALRCAPAEVAGAAARAAEDGTARRKELERVTAALADAEADRLAADVPAPGAVRAVVTPPAGAAAAWARAVAHALAARGRTAFLGAVEDGRAHLAFARPRSGAGGEHMGERMRAAAAALGGKGGGAPDSAQGSGPDVAALEAALERAAGGG